MARPSPPATLDAVTPMAHQPSTQPLDQLDPHHELLHEHGDHVILRMSTLTGVLLALLLFTALTVGQARAEVWASETFHVHIPQIVNASIVLTIAVIKASLVALFFMQLKYDSPLNAIVFLFCIFAVGLFLGFSMIDLGTRGTVLEYKAGEIQKGGLGIIVPGKKENSPDKVNTGGKPIVEWARMARIERIGQLAAEGKIQLGHLTPEQYYWQKERPIFVHGRAHHEPEFSTAQRSRPPEPVGSALFAPPAAPAGLGHGGH
jgi:cytochrome c oxidase subunit 4